MNTPDLEVAILKSLWSRTNDGRWGVNALKGLPLRPREGFDAKFFKFKNETSLLTSTPPKNIHDAFSGFGQTDFFLKQSILPVVALVDGEMQFRCIGTAFVISCTGYLMTACHVIVDPQESGYGQATPGPTGKMVMQGLKMGVLIPLSPAYGVSGFRFFQFEESWYWGEWKQSPLFHESDKLDILTDVAICKIAEMPDGAAHQPLNLSLHPFSQGEKAYAIGYANMEDIPLEIIDGKPTTKDLELDLYVSVGDVMEVFPDNHETKSVPTPGPCFDFQAKIPGKMSGCPIFGAQGAVVRGVVSRSFSGDLHAYGAMLGPTCYAPLTGDKTVKQMMESGNEGMARIQGTGL
jgi:hypothetical protein